MSARFNPDDYVGSGEPTEDGAAQAQVTPEPDESIFDRVRGGASALGKYISGIGVPIEFPDLPEITEMSGDQADFKDQFLSYIPILAARDDVGKAEVFDQIYSGDARYGGVYQDKFGLPLIVWNDVPYYINKPGMSMMDFKEFLGETLKFVAPTKYAGQAKGLLQTAKRGALGYGATETALTGLETAATPKTTAARDQDLIETGSEIGTATAVGVGADVLPDVVKRLPYVGQVVRNFVENAQGRVAERVRESELPPVFKEEVLKEVDPDVEQTSKYPLTVGQRTAPPPTGVTPRGTEQLGQEAELRRTMADDPVGIREFDERQLQEITEDALAFGEEFGVGMSREVDLKEIPGRATEEIRPVVKQRAEAKREEANKLFKTVDEADPTPVATADGVVEVIDEMLDVPYAEFGMDLEDFLEGPLKLEYNKLANLKKKLQQDKFRDVSLKELNNLRKRLGGRIGSTTDPTEKRILTLMKEKFDDKLFGSVDKGLLSGDPEVLEQLQAANEVYREYLGLTGKVGAKTDIQKAANKILQQITDSDYNVHQVMGALFGHNQLGSKDAVPLVIRRLRELLPEDEFDRVQRLMKEAALIRGFTNELPVSKDRAVTRSAIVKNYNSVFKNNKGVIEELFTPEELKRIQQFRDDVMPTLWAEINNNPSGSAWTIMGALARRGLFSLPGFEALGMGRKQALAMEERSIAKDATRQAYLSGNRPLFSASTQAALKPQFRDEREGMVFDPLPDDIRANMMQQLDDIEQSPAPDEEVFEEEEQPSARVEMPTFEPLPQTARPTIRPPMPSPTLLGSPENQELAMRRQLQGGIAGLG
jgi:hypothetical protein